MFLNLNSDAIFIADSHFCDKSTALLDYLHSLIDSPPSQLLLMGDIAQVLLGNLKSSVASNMKLLSLIDSLESKGVQIIWFEGNHDFFLKEINKTNLLQKTLFIPRKQQPLIAHYQERTYLLAHGDLFIGKSYEFYIKILTNIPKLLQFIDYLSSGEIYQEIEKKIKNKTIRQYPSNHHSPHFFEFARMRIHNYKTKIQSPFDGIIEGHFHIGKKLKVKNIDYISLPSFYFTPRGIKITTLLK